MTQQGTLDVLVVSAESPSVECDAVEPILSKLPTLFGSIIFQMVCVQLLNTAFAGTPATKETNAKRRG